MASLRFKSLVGLACAVLLLAGVFPPARVRALGTSPQAILDTVNALRASRGLQPYAADAGIMAYAQEHSEYQARIHQSTHEHSDGSIPTDRGLVENVAGGDIGWITPENAVHEIWRDAGHMKTMIGYASGAAGVGVADDGTTEYYTLDVRPGKAATPTPTSPGKTPPGKQTATKMIPIAPLITMTVRPNGCTVHVVGNGQTLWAIAIAYGVTVDEIRALNGMAPDSTTIYIGQKLLVRCVTATPTSQTTFTPVALTESSRPVENTAAPTLNPTAPGTATGSPIGDSVPTALPGPPEALIAGLLILAGGTLLVVLAFALVRRR